MKGDTRNNRFRSIIAQIAMFHAMVNAGYPESGSHISIGGYSNRSTKYNQANGRFGNTGPAKLRKYAKAIVRARAQGFGHIKGMARVGSRPMGRIRPIVTSSMARAAKRRSYS